MDQTDSASQLTEEDLSEPNSRKRKRDTQKGSSDDENSESDEEEYEIFTKYFTENCANTEEQFARPDAEMDNEKLVDRPTTRKRKYVFRTEGVAPKKCRKFYYINELMTKPRRPKLSLTKKDENKIQESVPVKKHKMHFAKVDGSGHLCLMHRSHIKSDLFFNDEKKCNYEDAKKLDLSFHIVDEIALEGLDGITIEAFWKRLKNVFPNNISKHIADRIWRLICNNKRINFYILKEPREKLIFYDRCKYLDVDSGMFVEPFIEFKDIYPLASINGTEIRGSCSTYHTRKENNGVRKFSMDKAIKLYDQRLVFVADQTLRNKALINEEVDPNIELLDVEYCMLEKVGRSREQGEFTQGKMSLVNDGKRVYHNRKVLMNHFLIVHQNFCLKSFYRKRKPKQVVIMERIANILKTRPNYEMEFTEFRKIFGSNVSIVKLLKTAEFRKFFKIYCIPYRKLYPNATKQEYLHKNKHKERQVRVLRMIDPCANVTAIMDSKDVKEVVYEKTDDSLGHKYMNYEYLRDIFLYIMSSGSTGVTIQEIHDHFKTDFYSVRMAVRKLLLRNVISSSKIDLGRQQSLKFFTKHLTVPDCHIRTEPTHHQLNDETLSRVLKGYEKVNDSATFYIETEPVIENIPVQTQYKLKFEPFCCTAFLTETLDPCSEELTIYDIVIKGRDKLLLIESNLFAQYISEWDDFLLKRDDFSKGILLFQNGLGKGIYDFLTTVKINESIEVDNRIVFNLSNVTPETKISPQIPTHRIINILKNFCNPHSNRNHFDTISKIYLFEALFNESHRTNLCIEKLKNVFVQVMISDGKKKRKSGEVVKTEPKIEVEVEVSNNVVMEKFMGPNPCLEWCGEEEGIRVEIFRSTIPEVVVVTGTIFTTDDVSLTQRYINRANLILRIVNDQAIVRDVRTIYKDILKEEGEGGYDKKACKKSIVTIISKLVAEGYIKCYKIVMTGNNRTKSQCFICVHEIDAHHVFIRSTIDQLKLKFYVGNANTQKTITIKRKLDSPFSSSNVRDSITELKQLTTAKSEPNCKLDRSKGKMYGYMPKFVRMRVLHEHLFYVIRELDCEQLTNRQVFDMCKNLRIQLSQNDVNEMPPVYCNQISWKMFIPPLPRHSNLPKGWALACDIVLRMPLSVFVKIVNVPYDIPELDEFLKHPLKRHYLLKHLPVNVRNILLHKRKYFHSIYEVIAHLCYIGLLQLGPRSFKDKDQLFIYLNSKASLFDTCSSKPGYNQIEDKKYKKIPFDFKSANDVEIYWSEMLRICMNTQLGKRKVLDGQYVTIEDCASKPAMMETLKAKTFDGAVANDLGRIPGNRRGGAGFDSSIWSFVKRNWSWNSQPDSKASSSAQSQVKKNDKALPEPIQYDLIAKGGAPERKILKPVKPSRKNKIVTVKSIIIKKNSKKKIVRKIVAPRKRRIREYYDAIDKAIMKKNPTMRVEWDEEEDHILRYCRSALVFLCPSFKKQFIPYNVMRDVLHRIYPKSKNKTSRAIQRRIYGLLTQDEAIRIMETNIENLLNCDVIAKYFDQIRNRHKDDKKLSDPQMYIAFIYLLSYMFKHKKEVELLLLGYFATFDFFSDANISEFEVIVQNCESEANTTLYKNPKTVEDVTTDTIKSVVHCSMACRKNTIGWTFHLSRIYKKFRDDLIRNTVASLKKDQFFVQNKSYANKNVDNWTTPIKFSYGYNSMKTTTYTIEMYRETYRNFLAMVNEKTNSDVSFMVCNELNSFWENVDLIFEIPELGIILNPEIEDHGEVIEELAKRFRLYLDKICEKSSAAKKNDATVPTDTRGTVIPERSIDQIKNEVRHLLFRVPYLLEGDLDTYFKNMLDCDNNLEAMNYVHLMIVDLKKFAQDSVILENLKRFINAVDEERSIDDPHKLLRNLSKLVFGIQNIHQLQNDSDSLEDAFLLWESDIWNEVWIKRVEQSNINRTTLFDRNCGNVMENCIKKAKEGIFPSLDEIKEGMMAGVEDGEERNIPHITDLIMLLSEDRFPELDTDHEKIDKMKDHFIMQYPKLNEFVIEDLEHMKDHQITKKILDDEKVTKIKKVTENLVKQPQLEKVVKYISDHNGTENDIKMTEDLIDFIKNKKELGVPANEIKTKFINQTRLNLVDLLTFLCEINLVLRTGVASIVYVHYEYQSEWLTETFILTAKEKEIFELKKKQDIKEAKKNLKSLIGEKIHSSEPRRVQLKPWTTLDGSVNDEIFYDWLCIVLSRCIDLPNIPFSALCEQFHYIKPVDIYFLLEILQELGCVEIYLFSGVENCLFSARDVASECKATCLDSLDEMFVKATNVSGLCFGSFLDMNFLELLSEC